MRQVTPHNKPTITRSDRRAIVRVGRSGWVAYGREGRQVEQWFDEFLNGRHSILVSSGTSALFLALKGLGVPSGTEVAVPSYACSAVYEAVSLAECVPVPIDSEADSLLLDVKQIPKSCGVAIVVNTFGNSVFPSFRPPAGLLVIEDCAHSLGGMAGEAPLGTFGDASIFSFYASKIVTGGYGGLVSFKQQHHFDAAEDFRNFDGRIDNVERFNFYLSDLNAALIRNQLKRLPKIREKRQSIGFEYLELLASRQALLNGAIHEGRMLYRFVVQLTGSQELGEVISAFNREKVQVVSPITVDELLHRRFKDSQVGYDNSEHHALTTVSLPVYPALALTDIQRVKKAIRKVVDC